jgi:D-alanine-D-alanine ligase
MTGKLRIGVVFGGQSGEHEVSLVSAKAVMANLDREQYEVVPIGITKQGRWITGGDPLATLTAQADPALLPGGTTTAAVPANQLTTTDHHEFSPLAAHAGLDVIFPVLHGPMGEDGTMQGLLEIAGVPYVGCGVLAAAVGMDKAMMKAAFAAAGLPLVPWMLVRRSELEQLGQVMDQIEANLRYPLFIKPANMGSSVGISKAKNRTDLEAGLHEAARYDRTRDQRTRNRDQCAWQ